MRNYNVYLKGMEKGNNEKLFFLDKIDLTMFTKVIDFGCGKGDILKHCNREGISLIGIDHDPIMLQYAQQNVPNAMFYPSLNRELLDSKTLIIFSSVLHEVGDYWPTLRELLRGTGATVVIRDMRFSAEPSYLSKTVLSEVVRNSPPKLLADFISLYGLETDKDMYHWFLKYSYVDNWELEVQEDYFSFDYNDLFKLGTVIYEKNYTLEFKKEKVLKDFGIEMTKPTHTQLILKLN